MAWKSCLEMISCCCVDAGPGVAGSDGAAGVTPPKPITMARDPLLIKIVFKTFVLLASTADLPCEKTRLDAVALGRWRAPPYALLIFGTNAYTVDGKPSICVSPTGKNLCIAQRLRHTM